MKSRYLKGIIAILLAIVIELPMLSISIVGNAEKVSNKDVAPVSNEVEVTGVFSGENQLMTNDVLGASMSNGKSWAEAVYQNVTIDGNGVASKITNEEEQQTVLDFIELLRSTEITYYDSSDGSSNRVLLYKELTNHNPDDVLLTTDNNSPQIKYDGDKPVGYVEGNPVIIKINGTDLNFYYQIYYDINKDGKVTYGEYLAKAYSNVIGFDNDKKKLICKGIYPYGNVYAFSVIESDNNDRIHLEGQRIVDDWEYIGNEYVYKYGMTALFPKVDENNNIVSYENYVSRWHTKGMIFHYNQSLGKWEQLDRIYEVDSDGVANANLWGDGLYICVASKYNRDGEIIEQTPLDVIKVEPDGSSTDNGVKTNPTVTIPTAKTDLAYSGQALALSSIGKTNGGTLQYGLGTATTEPTSWSTDVPMAKDSGTYYVWYRVVGDANYNDVAPAYIGTPSTIVTQSGGSSGSSSGGSGDSGSGESKPSPTPTPGPTPTPDAPEPNPSEPQSVKEYTDPNTGEVIVDKVIVPESDQAGTRISREKDGSVTVKDAVLGEAKNISPAVFAEGQVYRLYNPNTGEHFYTKNSEERNVLALMGWSYESDQTSKAISSSEEGATPVYRVYNPNTGIHHYTTDKEETVWLKSIGWNYEGISLYAYDKNFGEGTPTYRVYSPIPDENGRCHHIYTTDAGEVFALVMMGYNDEGIAWRMK